MAAGGPDSPPAPFLGITPGRLKGVGANNPIWQDWGPQRPTGEGYAALVTLRTGPETPPRALSAGAHAGGGRPPIVPVRRFERARSCRPSRAESRTMSLPPRPVAGA